MSTLMRHPARSIRAMLSGSVKAAFASQVSCANGLKPSGLKPALKRSGNTPAAVSMWLDGLNKAASGTTPFTTERGQLGARKRIAGYEVVMSYSGELGARAAALAVPQLSFGEFWAINS